MSDLLTLPKDAPLELRRRYKRDALLIDDGPSKGLGRLAVRADLQVDEQGRVEAYAALFHTFNAHNDYNLPGCFARAITARHMEAVAKGAPSRLKVTWEHRDPLGLPDEIHEDSRGLWTRTRIVGHDTFAQAQATLIREGVVDGLSIEFDWMGSEMRWMRGDEYELDQLGTPDDWWFPPREMRHVALLGYGFVMHPSADDARVEAARSIMRDLNRTMVQGWTPGETLKVEQEPIDAARQADRMADDGAEDDEATKDAEQRDEHEPTNFPAQGDDEPVSLANSRHELPDLELIDRILADYPQIWDEGGNVLGNAQYERLRPIVDRGGDMAPQDEDEDEAIRLREAWAARHAGDFQLAGVVAQLKWLTVGDRGAGHQREVIEAEMARIDEDNDDNDDGQRSAPGQDYDAAAVLARLIRMVGETAPEQEDAA